MKVNASYVAVAEQMLKATRGMYDGELTKAKAAEMLYLGLNSARAPGDLRRKIWNP